MRCHRGKPRRQLRLAPVHVFRADQKLRCVRHRNQRQTSLPIRVEGDAMVRTERMKVITASHVEKIGIGGDPLRQQKRRGRAQAM
jgi:hypothetical protein